MDRLASCYFCGAALDASLDEYPVVPEALRPDAETRKTVVLCAGCRRKLDAVLESVAEAVDRGSADSIAEMREAEASDRSGDGDDVTAVDDADSAAAGAEESGASADDEQSWISGDAISKDQTDQSDGDSAHGSSAAADDTDVQAAESTDSADDGSRAASGTDGESEESRDSAELSDAKLTRLENTKVMRLLQNREFPVDKQEFVTVAANAYDISRSDCEKILDLAVEHDLLDEENGQLLAGDR